MPRNSSGTYSLPAGNPVVSNTLIEVNWANPTMADIGQALTESLDRYGRGGMLAPFRLADGLVTAPALSFASETSTGIYRTTAGTWNLAILGVNVFGATSTGVDIQPNTQFAGTLGVTGAATFTAGATFNGPPLRAADPATANELTRKSYVDNLVTTSGAAFVKKIGDTMSGALSITAPSAGLQVQSGSLSTNSYIGIGRTSATFSYVGISGAASGLVTGDSPGDMAIRANEGALRLALGVTGYLTVNTANGVTVGGSLNAVGNIINNTGLSGVRSGMSPGGLPAVQWTNASGGANSKLWDFYASTTNFVGRAIDDAFSLDSTWVSVTRSGTNITAVSFPTGQGVGVGMPPPNYGSDIRTVSVNANGQSVFDLHIGGVRTGTFTVAAGASTAVTMGSLGNRPVDIVTNTTSRLHIGGSGLVGIGRVSTAAQLEIAGGAYAFGSEGFRIANDAGYISWFNTANTARLGYMQNTVAGATMFANESAGGYFQWNLVGAAGALTVNTSGAYVGPGEPYRLTRVNEFTVTSTAASFPGGRIRFGRVAAVVGTGGTITFASPFSSVYACVANVEGAQGGGWVLRYFSLSVNGFSYSWDNYNTAGGGAACFIQYYAIGI